VENVLRPVIAEYSQATGENGMLIAVNTTRPDGVSPLRTNITFRVWDGGASPLFIAIPDLNLLPGKTLDDGEWHHVVCAWDGTTTPDAAKIWVDGDIWAQATATGPQTNPASYNTTLFRYPPGLGSPDFEFVLDELEIYNVAYDANSSYFQRDTDSLRLTWKNPYAVFPQHVYMRMDHTAYPETPTDGTFFAYLTTEEEFISTWSGASFISVFARNPYGWVGPIKVVV
jgi:hypothetical protein